MTRFSRNLAFIFSLMLVFAVAFSQKSDKKKGSDDSKSSNDPMSSGTFSALKWRSIGPSVTGGRIVSLSVNPHDHSTYFVGVACGGVWKTTNAGNTYTPVFDGEGSYSIGTVVIDTTNPFV